MTAEAKKWRNDEKLWNENFYIHLLWQKEAAEAREAAAEAAVNGRVPVENGDVEAGAPEVAKFGWIVGVLVSDFFMFFFGKANFIKLPTLN